MIRLTRTAARQLDELLEHYIARERDQAIVNLSRALDVARERIEGDPSAGRLYPTLYPEVVRWQFQWIKSTATGSPMRSARAT